MKNMEKLIENTEKPMKTREPDENQGKIVEKHRKIDENQGKNNENHREIERKEPKAKIQKPKAKPPDPPQKNKLNYHPYRNDHSVEGRTSFSCSPQQLVTIVLYCLRHPHPTS